MVKFRFFTLNKNKKPLLKKKSFFIYFDIKYFEEKLEKITGGISRWPLT